MSSWPPLTHQDVQDAVSLSYGAVTVVAASGDTTGAADKAAINAALAAGGRVRGKPGATFYLNGPLVIPSDAELDMTGCTLLLTASARMLRSYAEANPTATATDAAMTAGSNVVTTALGASATAGQLVTVNGASTGGYQAICGVVSAQTATTITLVDFLGKPLNAGTAVSAAGVALRTATTNVRIVGGTWSRQNNDGLVADPVSYHSLSLRYFNGLRLSGQRYTSTLGKYAISLAGTRNFVIEDQTGLGTNSDGVHIDGPATAGVVRNVYGTFGDDMVAVTPMDWHQFGDIAGDVTDVLIENITPTNTVRAVVKILGGAGCATRHITIRNVAGSCTTDASAIWVGDDNDQPETAGGYIDQVLIQNCAIYLSNNNARQLMVNGSNVARIVVDGWTLDNPNSTIEYFAIWPTVAGTIDSVSIANVSLRSIGSANREVLRIAGTASINKITLRDWHSSTTTGFSGVTIASGTVGDLIMDAFQGTWQPWGNGLGSLVYMQLGTTGALSRASFLNCHVLGNGAGSAFVLCADSQTVGEVLISEAVVDHCAWLFALATTTDVQLSNVVVTNPGQGLGYAYSGGNVTVSGAGCNLAAGGANWQTGGGKIAVRVLDAPPSTNAGNFPTIAAGAGAGTSPTVSVAGTDRAGAVTITPGTSPAAGAQATVTFVGTWPRTPTVMLTPTNAAARTAGIYTSAKTAATFTVSTGAAPAGAMTFDYWVAA